MQEYNSFKSKNQLVLIYFYCFMSLLPFQFLWNCRETSIINILLCMPSYWDKLMARNFHDASHEGDSERLIQCWKFLLLHFKADSRVRYSVEAFHFLAQVNALFPPYIAHQLINHFLLYNTLYY